MSGLPWAKQHFPASFGDVAFIFRSLFHEHAQGAETSQSLRCCFVKNSSVPKVHGINLVKQYNNEPRVLPDKLVTTTAAAAVTTEEEEEPTLL